MECRGADLRRKLLHELDRFPFYDEACHTSVSFCEQLPREGRIRAPGRSSRSRRAWRWPGREWSPSARLRDGAGRARAREDCQRRAQNAETAPLDNGHARGPHRSANPRIGPFSGRPWPPRARGSRRNAPGRTRGARSYGLSASVPARFPFFIPRLSRSRAPRADLRARSPCRVPRSAGQVVPVGEAVLDGRGTRIADERGPKGRCDTGEGPALRAKADHPSHSVARTEPQPRPFGKAVCSPCAWDRWGTSNSAAARPRSNDRA